jgi:hypothetical protein
LTVFRHEAVQIDDERDLCWRAISDACTHRPRRTVPGEDDVVQIFALQHVDDVSDVHIDVIAEFLRAEVPSGRCCPE